MRFYYRFQRGRPAINVSETVASEGSQRQYKQRKLKRESIDPQQSILSQRKDPDLYPEVTATAKRFGGIQVFREWDFGRSATLRAAQPANLPTDVLLPQLANGPRRECLGERRDHGIDVFHGPNQILLLALRDTRGRTGTCRATTVGPRRWSPP